MAKKSNKPSPPQSADVAGNLKSEIHNHSLFFDRLLDLIPARFVLPTDDDKPWYQGLSKSAKAAAKAESRRNLKIARRNRHDPDKSSSTLDLLKKSIQNGKKTDSNPSFEDLGEESKGAVSDDRSVTYEELRQRLHKRIEELRSGRNTRPETIQRREFESKKKKIDGKRKRDDDDVSVENGENNKNQNNKKKKSDDVTIDDIAYGKVKLGGGDRKKGKKVSRQAELARAKKLEEAKKDPEKAGVVEKISWKAAVDRASGVKVHDNPRLLSKSLAKEKQRQKKSAGKWKDRKETVDKLREEKQKKRRDNIKERIHQKKMRKIEKREKKLMRPGFEGRKEGYINE